MTGRHLYLLVSLYVIRMSLISVCHLYLIVYHSYLTQKSFLCHSYFNRVYSYVIRYVVVYHSHVTHMSFVFHLYNTRMPFVYHSYVLICHSYLTRMSFVCHSYEFVCHSYVTHMSRICTSISFVFYSHVLVYYSYVTVCHSYIFVYHLHETCMCFYHVPSTITIVLIDSAFKNNNIFSNCFSNMCFFMVARITFSEIYYINISTSYM